MSLLTDLLEAPAVEASDDAETLTPQQFKELTAVIENLRKTLATGGNVTLDEARQIGVWFRARRKRAFSVMKEKVPAKTTSTRAPAKKKVLSKEEQQEILKQLLGDL